MGDDCDALLARNAELEKQRDEQAYIANARLDALNAARAELDNLRETLAQKIENAGHKITKWLEDDTLRLNVENAYQDAAAIVRGSDDEAGEGDNAG